MFKHRPILLLLALVSVALLFMQQRPSPSPETKADLFLNNYFLQDFETLAFNAQGKAEILIRGGKLTQPINTQEHKIRHLEIVLLEDASPQWVIRADHGWIDGAREYASLDQNVSIENRTSDPIHVSTEQLMLKIPRKLASSSLKVGITQGNNILTGVGMEADLQTSRLTLLSDTRALYVPD